MFITPKQYADSVGCSVQYIHRLLSQDEELSGVIKVVRYSRFYTLEVSNKYNLTKKPRKKRKCFS